MNLYTRLSTFKAAHNVGDNLADSVILQTIRATSRGLDGALSRRVYPVRETLVFDGDGHVELLLGRDILSVATLTANGEELTEDTHYLLYPYNTRPATSLIRLNARWPIGRAKVSLTGVTGYADSSETTGATVQNTGSLGISGTSLDLAVDADVEAGDMLIIGSEDIYVSAAALQGEDEAEKLVATIVRGCNGTTAAAHTNGAPIARRIYPWDIEEACLLQSARMLTSKATGAASVVGDPDLGGFSFGSLFPAIQDLLRPHRLIGGY